MISVYLLLDSTVVIIREKKKDIHSPSFYCLYLILLFGLVRGKYSTSYQSVFNEGIFILTELCFCHCSIYTYCDSMQFV